MISAIITHITQANHISYFREKKLGTIRGGKLMDEITLMIDVCKNYLDMGAISHWT